ncbi:MAG TPA: peptidoglycan editing factor PgeF [Pyrinomonadaceae bacterium]|nr:peptidoglycan editing factor PgeF [Pyrinomonadaceae bacterium]
METITTDELELKRAGFSWRVGRAPVRALACDALEREGFVNLFSTRSGGVSPLPAAGALNLAGFDQDAAENIHENRRRFFALLEGEWAFSGCWQVHGADVRVVRDLAAAGSEEERCDAQVTRVPGLLLGVKTADCVPVIIGDPRTGACAGVHAGWRGTLAEIVPRALERMAAEFGTRPEEVRAAVGPAARACCYEVGPEVVEAFAARFTAAERWFTPTRAGHALADLQRANAEQLAGAGVAPERIHTLPLCTICRPELFFSYRRDRPLHGRTGRLLSVVGRRPG